ncbi:MAG: hypothetical protein A2284_05035 [Deltaproteobacteria bacterium RIFOXYA12_FULL_61_11]|nr:MAG: hypothetical protein A2284_05035 [Deltaproteobacteria bacterium RIFOXYA12_FULL_61_11]
MSKKMNIFMAVVEMAMDEARNKIKQNPTLRELIETASARIPVVGGMIKDYLELNEYQAYDAATDFDQEEDNPSYDHHGAQDTMVLPADAGTAEAAVAKVKDQPCKVDGCDKKSVYSVGFCRTHYQKYRRGTIDEQGNAVLKVEKPIGRKKPTASSKSLSKGKKVTTKAKTPAAGG